jgi:hypothetical protein
MKLVDYTTEILTTIAIMFVLGGLGYLIESDMHKSLAFKTNCIAAGMQYSGGSCVK